TISALVTSDGATITLSLEQSGSGDLTMIFSDGLTTLVCTPSPCTVALTAGSDTAPTLNYVYLTQAAKTLVASAGGWPAEEHIKVGTFVVKSANWTNTYGALKNQNWNDHLTGTDDQGHLSHIETKIRAGNATYESGVSPTLTITPNGRAPDNVELATSSGVVKQLHDQAVSAMDMGVATIAQVSAKRPFKSVPKRL
ncbi:unnamed protein product, partial [marine sediment metagenome]